MTKHEATVPPVTEVDLALFAEGLLTSQRFTQVCQFLKAHPELREFAEIDELSEDGTGELARSVASDDSLTNSVAKTVATTRDDKHVGASHVASDESVRGWRYWLHGFPRGVALATMALGSVFVIGMWRSAEAIESTLSQTEVVLRTDFSGGPSYLSLAPQVQNSRIALEQLGNSFWLSGRNSLRRDRLLASIYVTQAQLEQPHFRQLDYADRPLLFPPLALCNNAIELLEPQIADPESRQILADAHQLRGRIHYIFGTVLRSGSKLPQGVNQKSLAADAFLSALEMLPPAKAGSAQYLNLAGMLFKSIHKGSFNGKLSDVTGADVPASTVLLPRLFEQFPQLGPLYPDVEQRQQHLTEITNGLGVLLMQQPVSDVAQTIAMMDICNSYGLRMTNGNGELEQAVASLMKGIQLAETIPADQRSADYMMTYGRLLGNIADAFEYFDQLEEEVKWRPQAIAVFREISIQQRTEESFYELGWVTGRQLIAEYRMQARYPDRPSSVAELLGALRQISNNLSSLDGYQLGGISDELIYAILAETHNDVRLGRGAAIILLNARHQAAIPPAIRERMRSQLEDFRGNSYLSQVPEFQEALKILMIEPAP